MPETIRFQPQRNQSETIVKPLKNGPETIRNQSETIALPSAETMQSTPLEGVVAVSPGPAKGAEHDQ
jgi:hypothetical protein